MRAAPAPGVITWCAILPAARRRRPGASVDARRMIAIALDIGSRRIGVARSDPTGTLAQPLETLDGRGGNGTVAGRIVDLVQRRSPEVLVVGLPRSLDGSIGPAAQSVLDLVEVLRERLEIPVRTWDERLTTVEAERRLDEAGVSRRRQRGSIDRAAAALILQEFLDQDVPVLLPEPLEEDR